MKKVLIVLFTAGLSLIFIFKYDIKMMPKNNNIDSFSLETIDEIMPKSWQDNGIFSEYYNLAYELLKTLSLDEKIGQLLLVRYPKENQLKILKEYHLSGYLLFGEDFKNKTYKQVQQMTSNIQNNSKIPMLIASDEEGGKVSRISLNDKLVSEKFKSPSELYALGGFTAIKQDTINKSKILLDLGINLNLAPVVDVSTNENDYMYERTLKQNSKLTSLFAKTVVEASKGSGVSYTLKHFPGYGNNVDTHLSQSVDLRTYEEIMENDILPFEVGIASGAEAIMISHNIVNSIDSVNPASLSLPIHNILKDELGFTGIIITDDVAMSALDFEDNVNIRSVLAGNNLIITTDYEESFNEIKNAVVNGVISKDIINELVFKTLAWKYYKKLM